jgi:hypothetical protein
VKSSSLNVKATAQSRRLLAVSRIQAYLLRTVSNHDVFCRGHGHETVREATHRYVLEAVPDSDQEGDASIVVNVTLILTLNLTGQRTGGIDRRVRDYLHSEVSDNC